MLKSLLRKRGGEGRGVGGEGRGRGREGEREGLKRKDRSPDMFV